MNEVSSNYLFEIDLNQDIKEVQISTSLESYSEHVL